MENESYILLITAGSLGFIHTILGPDHYLPFIVMAKSGEWSITKTSFITVLCGTGHVLSSVVIGLLGILLGFSLSQLEIIESFRGNLAAWALIAFGFVYMFWGIRRAYRKKTHDHKHIHS